MDKFLLGRLSGTTAVAVYGVGGQINTMYTQFSTSISNVFVPKVNKIVANSGDGRELTSLFTRVGRVQFIVLALILTGFSFFGQSFIKFWAGDGYEDAYYVAMLLITPVTVPLIQNLGIEIQRAKNMHKARSVVYFCIAIANIGISIPLIRLFGPAGAASGTAIALTVGNIFFMNWYYHSRIGLDMFCFWKSIAGFIPALIVPVVVGVVMSLFVSMDSLMILFGCIVFYSFVYVVSVWFLGMNDYEKDLIMKPVNKVLKRK